MIPEGGEQPVTLTELGVADPPWEQCSQPGCLGARARADSCLAHLDESALVSVLAGLGRGSGLDARGVNIDFSLLSRILAACPRDTWGRPKLNRGRFDRATFSAGVGFERVVFTKGVSFAGARFDVEASFTGARFEGPARFAGASFKAPTSFDEATFASQAWFGGATFGATASFGRSEFSNLAWFGRAEFETDAAFDDAIFRGNTNFDGANFGCHVRFAGSGFLGEARLDQATFNHEPRYDGAAFTGKGGAPQAAVRQAVWKGAAVAPWQTRAVAGLVDFGVFPAAVVAAGLIGALLEGPLRYNGALIFFLGLGVLTALGLTVRNLIDQGETGQTTGKRRRGLTLVNERDGLPVGVPRSLGRQALHILDILPAGIGLLRPLWNAKGQTFADTLATTLVVEGRGWAPAGSSSGPQAAGPPPGGG